jgi:hypothetical protein
MTAKSLTRARATPTETAERVDHIADLMRRGQWVRGVSGDALAEAWGVDVPRVNHLAAEASRVVAREVSNPREMQVEIATVLRENLHRASAAGEYKAVASLGDVASKVLGARAPEKHEHAHVVASYEAMPATDKAAWLRAKAAEMLEEADRLDGVVRVQVAASTAA